MKRSYSLFLTMFLLLSLTSIAYAQRGAAGGRGGRGGDGTPNPPQIQLPIGERPEGSFTIPENWGEFSLPEGLPTSPEDIQAMLGELEMPFDLESIEFGTTSPEAYAAIVGFGQNYLGIYIDPFYAGDLSSDNIPTDDASMPQEIPVETSSITSQLPTEIQTIMGNASGTAYWGLWDSGAAAVYTDIVCEGDACTIDVESLQVSISSASIGAYVFYRETSVSDANGAYNLILNTYPSLAAYEFEPYAVEAGYAFVAYTLDVQNGDIRAAITGVMSEGSVSFVYAIYGVGEAYVDIMR